MGVNKGVNYCLNKDLKIVFFIFNFYDFLLIKINEYWNVLNNLCK